MIIVEIDLNNPNYVPMRTIELDRLTFRVPAGIFWQCQETNILYIHVKSKGKDKPLRVVEYMASLPKKRHVVIQPHMLDEAESLEDFL